ncbi:hypothetical protein R1T08_25680 [Streptomyces sp. SBC-4]|nr:hypothetical protein [Streptomyces sp. SBC-4]MDV5147476.1 hypothetical protein [Streptomyces sp. SBC-4]
MNANLARDARRTSARGPHPSYVAGAAGDEPDARWWAAPLVGTLVSPLGAYAVSGTQNMWAAAPFMLVGSLVVAFALIVPSWFLARTRRRHRARVALAALGTGAAVLFPYLISTAGWMVFIVMLLTGNVSS